MRVSSSRRDGSNLAQEGEFESIIEIRDELFEVSCVFDISRLVVALSISDFESSDFFFLKSKPLANLILELV